MPLNKISNERAYVLGLLTGGGTIANATFVIVMPFDKWGTDPKTAAVISIDLLTKVRALFSKAYKIDIGHEIGNKGRWSLKPIGKPSIQPILDDLSLLALPKSGNLLDTAELATAKATLSGLKAEHFLTGIFDARASLTKSHRRFNDSAPIVSIEIPGSTMNFKFVMQLCNWLTDLGSVTDQILYNHPCQHATSDPAYSSWKKGFKIRFLAKSFIATHSFAMRAKATAASALANKQTTQEQTPCQGRPVLTNTVSIHKDIKCVDLPEEVRGKLFLHYHHICAALGCPHAPLDNIRALMPNALNHISVFPKLSKGQYVEMKTKHSNLTDTFFPAAPVAQSSTSCHSLIQTYPTTDYPDIGIALAYLLTDTLNGKRHRGHAADILAAKKHKALTLRRIDGIAGAPLFIGNKGLNRGVLLSSPTSAVNSSALTTTVTINGIDINVR